MATPTNLPASFSTGAVLTAAQMNNIRGAFRILQVLNFTTDTTATNATTTLADSGVTLTITPQSTSSKILIFTHINGVKSPAINTGVYLRLLRGSTTISNFGIFLTYNTSSTDNQGVGACSYLDSPATTSATTYKVQFARNGGTGTVEVQNNNARSDITLMEVSA